MKQTCDLFTSKDISCLVDGELPEERRQLLLGHIGHCEQCRSVHEAFLSLSDDFSRRLDFQMQVRRLKGDDTGQLTQRLTELADTHGSGPSPTVFGFFGKHAVLKLGMMAALSGIGFFLIFGKPIQMLSDGAGPSAIVKSVDADYTSVMIIETRGKKHTIIWLSET